MNKSIYNPKQQEKDISSKIVVGLERISEVFKVLLWQKAKVVGLSPIQIQIIIFLAYHKPSLCNISHLAKEFNVTKPTISDAIRILDKKGMLVKQYSSSDSRSYSIFLSDKGKETLELINDFSNPLLKELNALPEEQLDGLSKTLTDLIYQLNRSGILTVQRTCFACKFYSKNGNKSYCQLLKKELHDTEIRLDCPEFEGS